MGFRIFTFASLMLLFGSISTVTLKFQDTVVVGAHADGRQRFFRHPALQASFMFFGEALCLIPYFIFLWLKGKKPATPGKRLRKVRIKPPGYKFRKICAFALPAMCDATATTLLNIGLFYTYASTYQMLRGTVVLYAGLFTLIVMRRKLFIHHWIGMGFIATGAAIVGAASIIYRDPAHAPPSPPALPFMPPTVSIVGDISSQHRSLLGVMDELTHSLGDVGLSNDHSGGAISPLFGDTMIFLAQIFAALQFILEEKYLSKFRVEPMLAVGIEGMWGLLLCIFALPMLTVLKDSHGAPVDNGWAAVQEVAESRELQIAVLVSILCVGFLNFFGLQVTKALSGASRASIDACRTLFVWMLSVYIGWESFHGLEIGGFILLVGGTSLYNEVIKICLPSSDTTESDSNSSSSETEGVDEESSRASGLGAADDDDGLRKPLLARDTMGPMLHGSPTGLLPGVHLPKHSHVIRIKTQAEEPYTLARSWILGFNALSPKPLDSVDADSVFASGPASHCDQYSPGLLSNTSSYLSTPAGNFLANLEANNDEAGTSAAAGAAQSSASLAVLGAKAASNLDREDSTILVGSLTAAFANSNFGSAPKGGASR